MKREAKKYIVGAKGDAMTEKKEDHSINIKGEQSPSTNVPCCSRGFFEIRVRGHLNGSWSDWLEDLEIKLLENGEMLLSGPVADQAALMGILNKLSRLNLALLAVNEIDKEKG